MNRLKYKIYKLIWRLSCKVTSYAGKKIIKLNHEYYNY